MNVKHRPKLELTSLLKRRKTTLANFIVEMGIFSYEKLTMQCDVWGVVPPTLPEYEKIKGEQDVSSPTEGIVVIEPDNIEILVKIDADDDRVKKPRKKKSKDTDETSNDE